MQKTQITEAGDAFIITGATEEQRQRLKAAMNEPKPATEKMLTRKQVAALLGVHVESVKRYGRKKLLNPVRFSSRAVRYSEAEVLNLMRNGAK